MMDFEISEFHNSTGIDVRGTLGDCEDHEGPGPGACDLIGASSHEELQGQVSPVNLQNEIHADVQRDIRYDEPKDQVEPVNLHNATPRRDEDSHNLTGGSSEASPAKVQDKSNVPPNPGEIFQTL